MLLIILTKKNQIAPKLVNVRIGELLLLWFLSAYRLVPGCGILKRYFALGMMWYSCFRWAGRSRAWAYHVYSTRVPSRTPAIDPFVSEGLLTARMSSVDLQYCQWKCRQIRERKWSLILVTMAEDVSVYIHLQQTLICCSGICHDVCSVTSHCDNVTNIDRTDSPIRGWWRLTCQFPPPHLPRIPVKGDATESFGSQSVVEKQLDLFYERVC